jgi:VCBS repeat-containing protein
VNDALLLQTLARIEEKVDVLTVEVAEIRGARKVTVMIAGLVAAVVGGLVGTWRR